MNLNSMTGKNVQDLCALDETYIGTPDYMGITFFWAYAYRHYLRDASPYRRKLVHKSLLKAGLDVGEESDQHFKIVKWLTWKTS